MPTFIFSLYSFDSYSFSLEDIPANIDPEIIFFVHNETSSGYKIPKKFMLSVMERFPNALYICDIVSSAPVCDIPIKKLDLTYLSVQKGFGLPAGLGVGILSPLAIERAKEIENKNPGKNKMQARKM